MQLVHNFAVDENGFIVSAELVLVATVLVLGMLVGMSQVQNAVVSELNDVGHAIGALNQTYYYSGFHARKWLGFTKSRTSGSAFFDLADACDYAGCNIACDGAYPEGGGFCGGACGYEGYGYSYSSCSTYSSCSSGAVCSPAAATSCGSTCGATCAPLIAP